MTNARTVTRRDRFHEGFDQNTGVRRTKVGDKQKTHVPQAEGLIVEFQLPADFTAREVPARADQAALPYQEYRVAVQGGYVLINSFLGKDAAGLVVIAKAKVGEKTIRKDGKSFKVYYLKFEETNEVVTHRINIVANDLVIQDALDADVEGQQVFNLNDLNDNMAGGIIVTAL